MGKTRKNKIRVTANSNPMGVSDMSELAGDFSMDDESQSVGPIESIRDQLQNSNIEEKMNGLQSLAVLSANKQKLVAICSSDVVRIAAPLLFETNDAVRNAAAGALRNLSVCGLDVCEYLVDQDVLTPLLALLNEFANDLEWIPSFDASMKDQLDLKSDIFLQAINLLWNLCESTSTALDLFNQTYILGKIIRCLDYKIYGLDISISVAQCLLVVSENNQQSWNCINNHIPEFLCLLSINGEHSHTFLRTLAAGILSNVPAISAAYTSNILNALSQTLEVNHLIVLKDIENFSKYREKNLNVPELEVKMDAIDDETEEAASLRRRRQELPTDAEVLFKKVGNLLDAQRLAAEIITNICSADDDEWVDDDNECSDNESIHDYDMMKSCSLTNIQNSEKLSIDIVENLKSFRIFGNLWQRAQPLTDVVAQTVRDKNPELIIKIRNLRISALLCLQNMCNTMSLDDLGGSVDIYTMWVELGQQVFKGPQDPVILEPSTSLMRSALDHLKGNKDLFNQMTESDLELMLKGVNRCSMSEIRANWLRMLGTLGCLLPEPLVKVILTFILETCTQEDDVWTISEAIDALMDMFGDNDWTEIVVALRLYEQMSALDNTFKNKIRQQKRELNERYPAVQTVRNNLSRFVKYLEKESVKTSNGL